MFSIFKKTVPNHLDILEQYCQEYEQARQSFILTYKPNYIGQRALYIAAHNFADKKTSDLKKKVINNNKEFNKLSSIAKTFDEHKQCAERAFKINNRCNPFYTYHCLMQSEIWNNERKQTPVPLVSPVQDSPKDIIAKFLKSN